MLRLAASSYLNSAPLIWSFWHGPHRAAAELLTDAAPARCAGMLAQGTVGAALIPVIEYQRLSDVLLVADVCVASRGPVRSVVLVAKGLELKDIKRIALDTSSRTSAALVQILFREYVGHEPIWQPAAPDLAAMLKDNDAALLIGDPAMTFPRKDLRVYDLATLWREFTGYGFVFAMWAAHISAASEAARVNFAAARDEGLAHSAEIVAHYAPALALPESELHSYLQENIRFTLDEDLREGLALYFRLAHRHGLITDLRPLLWLNHSA